MPLQPVHRRAGKTTLADCNASLFIDATATHLKFGLVFYTQNCNASLFIDATATQLETMLVECVKKL